MSSIVGDITGEQSLKSIDMESIVLMRKHLSLCGVDILQKSTQNYPFNARNVTIFIQIV